MRYIDYFALLCLVFVLCIGCATPTAEIYSTPSPTEAATVTLTVVPSSTLTLTATAAPSHTPLPSATATTVFTPTPRPTATPDNTEPRVLGRSVEGRPIVAYRFGNGRTPVVFVGGVHGGYEWNTILLAYEMIDHYTANPERIPASLSVYIIPSANPDGQFLITGKDGRFTVADIDMTADQLPGRFNANGVDLNRNWDCQWSEIAYWRDQQVNSGTAPFSEPENQVLRDFLLRLEPRVVVFWHSAANTLFAGGCGETDSTSLQLADVYGTAADYPVAPGAFSAYPVTGDASDWLTTQNIPSFAVELLNHEALDWEQNLAGTLALLEYISSN